jgi:4-alpha-glucanotransferase
MARTAKSKPKSAPLDELADVLGIEDEFKDARGKLQRTSKETKRSLLAAMGIRSEDDRQIEASLEEIVQSHWSRALQPVYVIFRDDEPIRIRVTLPAATKEITWHLRLEEGIENSRRVAASELPLLETREIAGEKFERRELSLGNDIPWGYHRLQIEPGGSQATLIVAPERCWLPGSVDDPQRIWGVAAQVYTLKSQNNWGIGDFGDLQRLATSWAAAGADIVGVNPLHALFPDNPEHASPYSPSSRLLLNVLYIDVTAAPGFSTSKKAQEIVESDEFQKQLRECRAAPLVDYTLVTKLKLQVLRTLFNSWTRSTESSRADFDDFCREHGERLVRSCTFYCLRRVFAGRDPSLGDWRKWPQEYRDPESPAVRQFMEENSEEVAFAAWLQWLADRQLSRASAAASSMAIGLYRDLAVGADPSGTETWFNQKAVVSGASIGAPPDIFNPAGQNWGLPPFHPRELREQCYASFIELIRANMRYAGALRVDHVMALQHLYWIPESQPPQNGAYVRYPMEDLIGILALESQRNRCMVVGEDLGTVPDGFRERMERANILSYRVLFFEQDSKTGVFRKPKEYPRLAMVVASNHDLPTVPGWWLSLDIELRDRLKLYPDAKEVTFQAKLRQRDQTQLKRALERLGLLRKSDGSQTEDWVPLVYAYLARSSSFAALVQLDDVTGEVDPVNLPGSTIQYPNWRRKLSAPLEELLEKPLVKEVVSIFSEERSARHPVLQKSDR